MGDFEKQHTRVIRLWIVLCAITALSGYFTVLGEQKFSTQGYAAIVSPNNPPSSPDTFAPKNSKIVYTSVDNFVSTQGSEKELPKTDNTPEESSISLTIGDKAYSVRVELPTTVYDVMEKARSLNYVQFSSRDYGGDLGQLVEEINGIRSSVRDKKYWIYYINGVKATIGISNYRLQSGDTITWKYENETL